MMSGLTSPEKPIQSTATMQTPRFLTREIANSVRDDFGSPVYVYDEKTLIEQAQSTLAFPNAFGLTVRYAMKASPNAAILQLFHQQGLHIDASSLYEVQRAILAGIPPSHIALSTQELPQNFAEILRQGVHVNACSINQLERIGQAMPGSEVGIRLNPGMGSGANNRTNVGGPASSFGIWHEKIPEIQDIVKKYSLKVVRIHTHIGSGSDPEVWSKVALMSLETVRQFPDVHTLDLGGGYKVARMPHEKSTDLQVIGEPVKQAFEAFAEETGRKIHLEIEPGTYLAANSCSILTTVQDITDTGENGYQFLKLDAGMTDILRPSLYGAQHPIFTFSSILDATEEEFVICGHCCESGDILTPAQDQPEVLAPRTLPSPQIGDLCIIDGAGAYCSAMPAKNYNSFPEIPEVLLRKDGRIQLIRQRQTLEQVLQNERPLQES